MAKPWYEYYQSDEHGYIPDFHSDQPDTPHFAQDVPTPQGTVLTAPWGGTVVKADVGKDQRGRSWGGEVFVSSDVPGMGPGQEWYMFHLEEVDVKKGQTVLPGQRIGLSGGSTSSSPIKTDSTYSTGPHTHFGFFNMPVTEKNYEGLGVTYHNVTVPWGPDITPYLKQAAAGGGFAAGQPGADPHDICLACGPKDSDKYKGCVTQIGSGGGPPPCAKAAYDEAVKKLTDNITGQDWLDKVLKSLGVESLSDLAWRALFIAGGIALILFGLVMIGKSISGNVVEEAAGGIV